jgi:hypothetical protein
MAASLFVYVTIAAIGNIHYLLDDSILYHYRMITLFS